MNIEKARNQFNNLIGGFGWDRQRSPDKFMKEFGEDAKKGLMMLKERKVILVDRVDPDMKSTLVLSKHELSYYPQEKDRLSIVFCWPKKKDRELFLIQMCKEMYRLENLKLDPCNEPINVFFDEDISNSQNSFKKFLNKFFIDNEIMVSPQLKRQSLP